MTPYATLLSVRRVEEQQAEVALAEALREAAAAESVLRQLREARAAWLEQAMDPGAVSALEVAERDAESHLHEARGRVEAAREVLIERQRQRKVVEQLHAEALAARARAEARRMQNELDDIGSRRPAASTPEVRP
jgi:flagellar export protein FliJ